MDFLYECDPLPLEEGQEVALWNEGCLDTWLITEGTNSYAKTAWGYRVRSRPYRDGATPNPIHKQSGQNQDDPVAIAPSNIAGD
jgi:hypothetical protein